MTTTPTPPVPHVHSWQPVGLSANPKSEWHCQGCGTNVRDPDAVGDAAPTPKPMMDGTDPGPCKGRPSSVVPPAAGSLADRRIMTWWATGTPGQSGGLGRPERLIWAGCIPHIESPAPRRPQRSGARLAGAVGDQKNSSRRLLKAARGRTRFGDHCRDAARRAGGGVPRQLALTSGPFSGFGFRRGRDVWRQPLGRGPVAASSTADRPAPRTHRLRD